MQKTKIEWTDYSWNPIKGICPTGCWYCYARRIYHRFKWNPKIEIDPNELVNPYRLSNPSKIFLCSTIELFHPDIHPAWREVIFDVVRNCPQHTFQILTKFPQNIDRPMPDNCWIGITVEDGFGLERRVRGFQNVEAKVKFISFEPLLDRIIWANYLGGINWVIIGRLTGHGHRYDPEKRFIETIVQEAKERSTPIFLKNNLKEIWGEPLIQEFPFGEVNENPIHIKLGRR